MNFIPKDELSSYLFMRKNQEIQQIIWIKHRYKLKFFLRGRIAIQKWTFLVRWLLMSSDHYSTYRSSFDGTRLEGYYLDISKSKTQHSWNIGNSINVYYQLYSPQSATAHTQTPLNTRVLALLHRERERIKTRGTCS